DPRATDRAQIGAAAFHQQRLPELDRCVPAARLDQPWLPPDQSGEIDELVELVGAGRGGATAPTILDSRGRVPHGSVRGGMAPSIPLAITSLRVVLRSSAANAGTTLSMRSAKRADAAAMRRANRSCTASCCAVGAKSAPLSATSDCSAASRP